MIKYDLYCSFIILSGDQAGGDLGTYRPATLSSPKETERIADEDEY
jgi:hypothetical protein